MYYNFFLFQIVTIHGFIDFFSVEEKKEKTHQNIVNAQNKIRIEINELKERLKLSKETIVTFKAEITKSQTGALSSGNI